MRVLRACRELGVKVVSVHSTADEMSLHRKFSDEDVCIGPGESQKSYLYLPRIMSALEVTGVDGVHPGYGFLSESSQFSKLCEENGVKFIGPDWRTVEKMGDKVKARRMMEKVGVPVLPGSGVIKNLADGFKKVKGLGYPVMLKASAGGGGKGMRKVWNDYEFEEGYMIASGEAEKSFGSGDLYIEKCIDPARHIEIQILADEKGNIVHLGERDCSMQRKNQKILEEAPSPFLSAKTRSRMGESAIRASEAVDYKGVGTVEFLVDGKGDYYFIEMNTRIQVEHPVTEMITGVDLVQEQILVAAGEKLRYNSEAIQSKGHAIECRINAEDWENNFRPSTGKIKSYHVPGGFGVRIDSHLYTEYEITPYYDSLLAKVIVWGENRRRAMMKMKRVLGELIIEGVETTVGLHQKILEEEAFIQGKYDTNFLERMLEKHRKKR